MTLENKDIYTFALVIIGNEILSGRTQDTNTSWIAEQAGHMGLSLNEVRVVRDEEEHIASAVNELRQKVDYVFTTGGIGPTHDDITSQSIARAFGLKMELNQEAFDILVRHYGTESDVTPPRKKMAMIPEGATLINNPVSGAPGFQIENVFVLAGVPRIMQAMFDDVKGRLKRGKRLMSNTIACKLYESQVAEPLSAIQDKYPNVSIGSYPHFRGGLLGLSLVLRSIENDQLDQATAEVIAMVTELGGEPNALSIQSSAKNVAATP
jgi:molybdenum cofactor synthesis domain-containing protein